MLHDVILFDLDGTLSDPLEGIARSLNYALSHFGYETLTSEQLAAFVGPPLDQTFRALTGLAAEAQVNDFVAKYRERYAAVGYAENVLYPGVREALASLSEAGGRMAVCTSKRQDFAEQILSLFDLKPFFSFVAGGDVGVHKWQQLAALRAHSAISEASVMVGDRAIDLSAAHRHGLWAGGVLWGYGSYAELSQAGPQYLFRTPAEWEQLRG